MSLITETLKTLCAAALGAAAVGMFYGAALLDDAELKAGAKTPYCGATPDAPQPAPLTPTYTPSGDPSANDGEPC
jgi:hypothetical protein